MQVDSLWDRYLLNPAVWGSVSLAIGGAWYVSQMMRGITRPNQATWIIWAAMALVVGFSFGFTKPDDIKLLVYVTLGETLLVALLSFKYGERKPADGTERICIGVTAAALVIWAIMYFTLGATKSARTLLGIELLVLCYAALPTLIKAWHEPEYEGRGPWTFTLIGLVLGLVDVIGSKDPNISFAEDMFSARFEVWAYALVMLCVVDGPIALVLMFRGDSKRGAA
jgi:hypothetical protein